MDQRGHLKVKEKNICMHLRKFIAPRLLYDFSYVYQNTTGLNIEGYSTGKFPIENLFYKDSRWPTGDSC